MERFQGSFILTCDVINDKTIHMPNICSPTVISNNSTKQNATTTFQTAKSLQSGSFNGSMLLPSDDENENDELITTRSTKLIFPENLYDSDLDSDSEENKRKKLRTAKEKYLSKCREYRTQPSATFIDILDKSNMCVSIRYASLKPIDVKAMISTLMLGIIIKELDLSGNGFGSSGAISIATFIQNNEHINKINLSDNDIGQSGN